MTSVPIPEFPFPNPHNHKFIWTPLTGFIDTDIKGHLVLSNDNTMFKIMLWDFDGVEGYCRGQNKDFPTFQTSWQRLKTPMDRFLGWIQKQSFIDWFMRTPYYQHFAYNLEFAEYPDKIPEGMGAKFCFDFEAIAQHYEFPTNYLDMTTKRDVAEFFAYTYIDKKGNYQPIYDFTEYQPTLYIQKYNGELSNPYNPNVRIVGFQPLLRPIRQYAMAINLENVDINYKEEFYKEFMKKDKKKAKDIFEKFEGGKTLFPDDYASIAEHMIRHRILIEKVIETKLLIKYCDKFKEQPKVMRERLKKQGYKFSDDTLLINEEVEKFMKEDIDKNLIPWLKEHVRYDRHYLTN